MTVDELLEYQTLDEAKQALTGEIADLNLRAIRAREVGDMNQNHILHEHIDENLELLAAVVARGKLDAPSVAGQPA